MRTPIPVRMRFQVLERDEFTCQYCGAKAPDAVIHVDHVVPVCNGGPTCPENLAAACIDCNMGKSGSDLRFVPDHIIDRAGRAYERGAVLREAIRASNGESLIPAIPVNAPDAVLMAIRSAAQALSVSIGASRLTQDFVAGAVGISRGYMSKLRSGDRPIPTKLVEPLCAATGSNLLRQYVALANDCEDSMLADLLRSAE